MRDGKGKGKAKENFENAAHPVEEGFEYVDHDDAGPSTSPDISFDSPQDGETSPAAGNSSAIPPATTPSITMKQHYENLAFKAVREGNVDALKALLGSPAYVFKKTWETRAAIELTTAKLVVAEAMIECLREQNPIILQEQREKGQEIPQEKRQQVVAGIRKKLQDIIENIVQARIPEIMARYAAFSEERLKHWDVNPAEQIELLRLFLKEQFQEDILKSFLESLMRGGKKAPAWGELFQDIQTHYKNEAKECQDQLQKLQTTLQSETRAAERKYTEETAQWSLTAEIMPFLDVAQEEIFEFAEENNQDQPGPSRRRGSEQFRATPVEITRGSINSQDSVPSLIMLTANQKKILESRVDPNAVNEQGDTLLLCALRKESVSSHIIRHLLFSGAEPRIGDTSSRHLTPIDIVLEMPESSNRDTLLGVFAEHAEVAIQHPLLIERRHQLVCKPENWQSLSFVLKTHAAATIYLDAQTPEKKSQFIKLWETVFGEIGLAPTLWNAETAIDMQRKARKALLCTDPLVLATEVKQATGKSIFTRLAALTGSRIFAPLDALYKDYRAKMEKLGHPDMSKAIIKQGATHEVEKQALVAEVFQLKQQIAKETAKVVTLTQEKVVLQEQAKEDKKEIVALKGDNSAKSEELRVQDAKLREKDAELRARDEIIGSLQKNAEEQNDKILALEQGLSQLQAIVLQIASNGAAAQFSLTPLAASSSSNTTTVVAPYREVQRKNSRSSANEGVGSHDSETREQRENSSSSSSLREEGKEPTNEEETSDDKKKKRSSDPCRLM